MQQLGQRGDDPAAGRGERVAGGQRRAGDVQPAAVDLAERLGEAQPVPAEHRIGPGLQRGQHGGRERLVDLVEVEVLQGELVPFQQPGQRVHRRHQQPVVLAVAVHVVHRAGLGVHQVGQHRQPVLGRPLVRAEQHRRGAVGQRGRVARGHRWLRQVLAEHRLELGQLLRGGVRPQVLVPGQAQERGDQVGRRTRGRRRRPGCGGWRRPARPARPGRSATRRW